MGARADSELAAALKHRRRVSEGRAAVVGACIPPAQSDSAAYVIRYNVSGGGASVEHGSRDLCTSGQVILKPTGLVRPVRGGEPNVGSGSMHEPQFAIAAVS